MKVIILFIFHLTVCAGVDSSKGQRLISSFFLTAIIRELHEVSVLSVTWSRVGILCSLALHDCI